MNAKQRQAVLKYLQSARKYDKGYERADVPISQQQLVSRVNLELAAAKEPLIHEKDPDIGMLFRRRESDLLREFQFRPGNASTEHDIMFNSCWKVAFESALAAVVYRNRHAVQEEVMSTIKGLKPIVLPALKARALDEDKGLFTCYQKDPNANHAFYARKTLNVPYNQALTYPLKSTAPGSLIPEQELVAYYEGVVFREDNYMETFEEKLTAIYNFADFITRPHKFAKALAGKPKEKFKFTGSDVSWLLDRVSEDFIKYKLNGKPGWFDLHEEGNPSVSRKDRQKTPHGLTIPENKSGRYSGIWAVRGKSTLDETNPYLGYVEDLLIPPFYDITGVGLWRPQDMTHKKDDVAGLAMHRLDMPLIGGVSGGMGSYLLAMKWAGRNTTRETLTRSFFAAYSMMISKGYHSFHEVGVVGETLGLWYTHGDYLSMLEKSGLEDLPDMKELLGRFQDQLRATASTSKKYVLIFGNYHDPDLVKLKGVVRGSKEI